jgi:NAD(P)-dependent dehydrogenase (short-subunit alcohol dehydrogenase family)
VTIGTTVNHNTVLITGANRGIGRAFVDEALKRGAKPVHAAARREFEHADPRSADHTRDANTGRFRR